MDSMNQMGVFAADMDMKQADRSSGRTKRDPVPATTLAASTRRPIKSSHDTVSLFRHALFDDEPLVHSSIDGAAAAVCMPAAERAAVSRNGVGAASQE